MQKGCYGYTLSPICSKCSSRPQKYILTHYHSVKCKLPSSETQKETVRRNNHPSLLTDVLFILNFTIASLLILAETENAIEECITCALTPLKNTFLPNWKNNIQFWYIMVCSQYQWEKGGTVNRREFTAVICYLFWYRFGTVKECVFIWLGTN